jgi:hypothetical protein
MNQFAAATARPRRFAAHRYPIAGGNEIDRV